ncbi:MAG: glycosyltransferase family 4 protein [Elusimicrobia bacterium]|nr:glycosyltransferase family 4 protein [Elusimicrobiota bacterium]
MKIAIDGSSLTYGGGKTYLLELTRALGELYPNDQFEIFIRPSQAEHFCGATSNIRLCILHPVFEQTLPRLLWQQALLPVVLRKNKIDVFYAPGNYGLLWSPCPQVICLQNDPDARFFDPSWLRRFWWKANAWMFRGSARNARLVIGVSESMRRKIVKLGMVEEKKIVVVYHGVPRHFLPADGTDVKRAAGILAREPFLFFVGDFYPNKNLSVLWKALAQLSRAWPNLRLVIAGRVPSGAMKDRLDERARHLHIAERLEYRGTLAPPELLKCYYSARALVFPSKAESFGLPVIEAMACGLPVVASDIAVVREIAQDAALYFHPDDDKALAYQIDLLCRDQELWHQCSVRGLRQARHYSWDNTAKKIYEILRAAGDRTAAMAQPSIIEASPRG